MKTFFVVVLMALCVHGNQKSPRPPGYNTFTKNFKGRSSLQAGDIVEGDIMLDSKTAALYRGESRNAMKNVNLWKNGVVPYILDASVDDYLRNQIDEGIKEYHKYTCLRFVKRTNERDYIRVMKPASGCNSMVGAIGGEQILNMGNGCQYVGLVLHEFGHAIGYFHEHNRPDRDDVVNVMWDNIQYGFKDAFYKYTFDEADVQGFKYDLTSIMHYENTAFTNGYCRPTMLVKKDPSYEVTPVYLRKFSPQDIQKINKLYSCQTNQLPPTVLPGNGNPDPSQCVCEDKYNDCPGWRDSGECGLNLMWMSTNCPKSCRTCGEPPSDCQDVYPVACENWGKGGECSKNPIWMNVHCKRTCNQCSGATQPPLPGTTAASTPPPPPGTTQGPQPPQPTTQPPGNCNDVYPQYCPDYKKQGMCQTHVDYVRQVCKKTCGFCGGGGSGNCKDVYPQYCPGYKENGICTDPNYLDYVKEVCKFTCGFCS